MDIDVVLVVVGGLVLGLGLLSAVVKRLWLSAPLIALGTGVVLGPEVAGVLEPARLGNELRVLEETARVTLAISLTATGLQVTYDDIRTNAARVALLLTVGMAGMWVMSALGAAVVLGEPLWVALAIGAILTPTDPVVASTLVTGRLADANLPRWLRRTIQLESGANDGLAIGFVLLPVIVLTEHRGETATFAVEVARQIGLAVVVGVGLGAAVAHLVNRLRAARAIESSYFLVVGIPLALGTLGATHALGGSGVLASFVAGVTFSEILRKRYVEGLEGVQSGIERIALAPLFALFGAMLPWREWAALGFEPVVFAVWIVALRRLPVVAPALAATATPGRAVAFTSWFGPLGVAAIYYSTLVDRLGVEHPIVFPATTLAITLSIVVHSVTATPGVRLYAGRSVTATLRRPFDGDVDGAP